MSTRALQIELLADPLIDPTTGALCSGYSVEFYAAGTSTAKNVWTEKEKTNPFTTYTLDSGGKALLYGDGIYKIIVKNPDGTAVLTLDNQKIQASTYSVVQKSSNYTATPDDDCIVCDGTFTLAIQSVALFEHQLVIIPTDGSTITIDPYSTQTVGGLSTLSVTRPVMLFPDNISGTWRIDYTALTADDIAYTPAGAGAVATTVQAKLRETTSVIDFGATGDGVTDDTDAFIAAAAVGKPLYMPQGNYLISAPVTFTNGLFGAGAGDPNATGKTSITLTDTGQLIVGDWYCHWDGFEVRSSVNDLTFITNDGQSYWTFTNFVITELSSATGQIGINFDTTDASIYYCRLDNLNIRCAYPVKISGNDAEVFNANKIGMGVGGNKWYDFLSAITVDAEVLACDANEFGGYFETGTNVLTFNGVALRQNRFRLVVDNVTRVWNSTVDVTDMNLWEILDGGFTFTGTQPQNQLFLGPASTKIRATENASLGNIANSSLTIMTFDTEVFDTLSEFTPGTGKFEPKYTGYYQVCVAAISGTYTWPSGSRLEVRIYVNGSIVASGIDVPSQTASGVNLKLGSVCNTLLYLTGNNDYLEAKIIHNQGGVVVLDTDPAKNYISITRVA